MTESTALRLIAAIETLNSSVNRLSELFEQESQATEEFYEFENARGAVRCDS